MAQFKHVLVKALLMCSTLFLASHAVAALQSIPPLESAVTDLTHTLSAQEQQALATKLSTFSTEKGSQIAVLIVPTTQPEDIAQYSIRVAETWKIGRDKQDDGVIIVVAKDDRKMRVEVGYGLEGAIPDLTAKRIVTEVMAPHFKRGDFYGGLDAATNTIMRLTLGEALPAPERKTTAENDWFHLLPMIMFGVIVTGMILRAIFGTFIGSTLNAGLIGILVWVLGAALFAVALSSLAAFIFTLMMGSRGINGYGHYPGGYGGGSGVGGFGGGDVFTGGGDFGGGGASGDW